MRFQFNDSIEDVYLMVIGLHPKSAGMTDDERKLMGVLLVSCLEQIPAEPEHIVALKKVLLEIFPGTPGFK